MRVELFRLHAELEERHWWFTGRRRIMRRLVGAVVPPEAGTTVVDVGCGTGGNIAALSEDYRCIGIDVSPEAIDMARSRFPAVEFICGSAPEDLGAAAREASLFLLMDVLEHVDDDFELFSRWLAASRPGAHFLITVPADPAIWSEHDVSFGHYRRYDPQRLSMLWQDLPVEVRMLSPFNARLYPIIRVVREVNRRWRRARPAGADLTLPPAPLNWALALVFGGEVRVLLDNLEARRPRGYRRGVSLVALLRREEGMIETRQRPANAPEDFYNPSAVHRQ